MRAMVAALSVVLVASGVAACQDEGPELALEDPPSTSTSTTAPATTSPATMSPSTQTPPTVATAPSPSAAASEPVADDSSRIEWDGGNDFRVGGNLPWVNFGCDFGCGVDRGGASSEATEELLRPTFAAAREAGMNTIRWWLFPGDPWQIGRGEDGLPTRIDQRVYGDIDAALDLAEEFDIDFVFTLFSAPTALPAPWRDTPEGRQRLVDALDPLFARYDGNPRIMTWQIINEPEWEIWSGTVSPEGVQELVRDLSDAVHASSSALTSVGGARLDGLDMWLGLGLDYYTVHWYDPMTVKEQCARCTSYDEVVAASGVDAPIMIGEVYLGPDVDTLQRLEDFEALGYAGALAWSLLPDRTSDALQVDLAAVGQFDAG